MCMSERELAMKRYTRLPLLTLACLLSMFGFFGQAAITASAATAHTSHASNQSGKQVIGYFTQWGIYSGFCEKNLVTKGTAAQLTTLDYAFSKISSSLQCSQGD